MTAAATLEIVAIVVLNMVIPSLIEILEPSWHHMAIIIACMGTPLPDKEGCMEVRTGVREGTVTLSLQLLGERPFAEVEIDSIDELLALGFRGDALFQHFQSAVTTREGMAG